jgi:hypothetical protein
VPACRWQGACQQQQWVICWNPLLPSLQAGSLAAALSRQVRARLQLQAAALAFCQACHPQPHRQ